MAASKRAGAKTGATGGTGVKSGHPADEIEYRVVNSKLIPGVHKSSNRRLGLVIGVILFALMAYDGLVLGLIMGSPGGRQSYSCPKGT
jgi:hypothetical protein